MSHEQVSQEEIFNGARAIADPTERDSYLQEACGSDSTMRGRIDALLKADAEAGSFLAGGKEEQIVEPGDVGAEGDSDATVALRAHRLQRLLTETPGMQIGPYRLLERIGEGGFGEVWVAEQREPVRRKVAIKIVKAGMDTREVLARFEAERQALALMDHPGVAKVFDAGATDSGRPYFVMEYVAGLPINEYCDTTHLKISDRLALFIDVCQVVQHAHQKGIIHRDLKPSNILVTPPLNPPLAKGGRYDAAPLAKGGSGGVGAVKVIDFGIAKATLGRLTERTLYTEIGRLMGTPEYMAPEQTGASGLDVDTRVDIYSLGVILYELLTGTLPFDPKTLRNAGFDAMARIIRELEPPKPSTRLSTLAEEAVIRRDTSPLAKGARSDTSPLAKGGLRGVVAARGHDTDFRALRREVRGDLDWITLKALEKDRRRRYETPNSLASDIRRHLLHEPVIAGPPTAAYRLRKFIRRNRVAVAIGAIFVAFLVGATVVSTTLWQRSERAVEQIRQERDKAEQIAKFMEDTLKGADPEHSRGRDTELLKEMMDAAAKRILGGELADTPEAELRLRLAIGEVYHWIGEYKSAQKMLNPAEDLARSLYPPDHPQTANALWLTASSISGWGNQDEALRGYEAAQAMYRRLGDDENVQFMYYCISVTLDNLGRYDEALANARAGLEMSQRLYKTDHGDVLRGYVEVALELAHVGRPEEALQMYDAYLPMIERQDESQNLGVGRAMFNLGQCLLDLNRAPEALPRFERALLLFRRFYGRDHPNMLWSLRGLGDCLLRLGRPEDAVAVFQSAMEVSRRLNDPPQVLIAVNHALLAEALRRLGRLAQAEANAREAVQMFRAHPEWALPARRRHVVSEWFLVHILYDAGKTPEAIASSREVIAYARANGFGPNDQVRFLDMLSWALLKQAQPDSAVEAESLTREALALRDAAVPQAHELTWLRANTRSLLGESLAAQSRFDEGEEVLVSAYNGLMLDDRTMPRPAEIGIDFKRDALERIVNLYDAWDAAEPGQGYAAKAEEYRALLEAKPEDAADK